MIVDVALPLPLQKTFSYRVPLSGKHLPNPLVRVKVPLGNRMLVGFVVAVAEETNRGLRTFWISSTSSPLSEGNVSTLRMGISIYLAPIGVALKYTLPSGLKIERYLSLKAKADAVRHLTA